MLTQIEEAATMRIITIDNHQSEFPKPLQLKKGEKVKIEDKQTEFAGWVWAITDGGNSGWTPEPFLDLKWDDKTAIVNQNYNAHELNVEVGEELEFLDEVNEWLWVRRDSGEHGWIPKAIAKPI